MKQFLALVRFYLTALVVFLLAKPAFVWLQSESVRADFSLSNLCEVWVHGLPLDMAVAGYATAPVWLVLGIGLWIRLPRLSLFSRVYALLLALPVAVILVADTCLYGFWGTKLDGTVWNYLDSPQGALSSVTPLYALGVSLAILFLFALLFFLFRTALPRALARCQRPLPWTAAWVVIGGLLFLGIRGGVGKSTANVGMAYFSERPFLNHAAVNPVFSLIASSTKVRNFSEQYDFFEENERQRIMSMLHYNTRSEQVDNILTPSPHNKELRPNVLLILMEGCGGTFVHAIDSLADPQVTPHLNRLAEEGVVFTRCYANSFRTDRGTVSTLSGYPAYPDVSVMKLPSKCAQLPSIARTLKGAGYTTEFLYGGDINFTNTKGYLLATGYDHLYSETSFPSEVRRTHDWGVTDCITFDSLYQRILRYPTDRPWHLGFLTLASHEPWQVPYDRIKGDKVANAMAYLDDCIGQFIERFRRTEQWKNTLIILIPDHGINYPEGISDADERRSHIPLIWTGGAVREARRIPQICNQSDLAATLLGQLGLPHDDFVYSRDVLSRSYTRPSAVHTWSEGIYYMDSSGISVLNLLTQPVSTFRESPRASTFRVNAAKAFLQSCYDQL